ncbi:MAG: serine hydrolase [bacterium]
MKKILFFIMFLILQNYYAQVNIMSLEMLKDSIKQIISTNKGDYAVLFQDLKNPNNSVFINEKEDFHTASTMKTPVMIEVFNQISMGKFKLEDTILVKNEFKSIVDGSLYSMDISRDTGDLIYEQLDKYVTIKYLVTKMITVSSNLATNILIDLVDAKNVNNSMRKLGANDIQILRGVEDMKAFEKKLNNTTTAYDMFLIYKVLYNNEILNQNYCNQMIDILKQQEHNTIIPGLLPKGTVVAHKTGTIDYVVHDCGIVYPINGNDYILIYLSKNVESNSLSIKTGAKISKLIYDYIMFM